ncbi:MAG TPA: spermidine/putrescine ABC transporter substrate-binding protein [Gammaproteobacteria bacterium]|nr:spermidine/putrescine ABC transporter substrate-binding protein [Gammaproteobacteria bacterium]
MKKVFLLLGLLLVSVAASAKTKELNVYNWSNYMPKDVIVQFEKETGIHVNYSTYDGNDTLYAKLKADPHAGYDIIVPTSYFVDRMRNEHMLLPLDKSKLSNFKNLDKALLNKSFDPGNQYSIPYFWGSTGIVVNKNYFDPNTITSWNDLWNPRFKDQLLILDDPHDVFSMALMALGYSANDADPDHLHQAYLKLKALLPNVKLFNSDAAKVNYIDEDATIGMGYSGDTYQAMSENSNLVYVYPKEGFVVWVDCMAIPKYAPHADSAYKFMNFLMRPDIAAKLSEELDYASPNAAAKALLPKAMRENPAIYPDDKILARAQFEVDPGNLDMLYEKYMEELKVSA